MTIDPNRVILRDYVSVMRDAPTNASIWDVDPEAGERILDALVGKRTCAVELWNGPTRDGRRLCSFRVTRTAKEGAIPLCTFHYNQIRTVGFTSALRGVRRDDLDPVEGNGNPS